MKRHTLTLTALLLVLASLLAGPASARPSPGQDEYHNNGWYTGLEHRDLPSYPAGQNEYRNNGWYTGLEHKDLPTRPAVVNDYLPWLDPRVLGVAATAMALLLGAKAVAGHVRHRRVTA